MALEETMLIYNSTHWAKKNKVIFMMVRSDVDFNVISTR